ncbi:MAG: hypothetical protein LBQ34_07105 [Alphaproteobacteria bacterium]|jgi:hypothetical protein|nr:hypothetical protein [Alphaproteobacteria bacterium]
MSAITEYQAQKADILNKSNNLLIALNNKRASEKAKVKNRMAAGNGGSNEDVRFFTENSMNAEEGEILRDKEIALANLKETSINAENAKAMAKRKQTLSIIKEISSALKGL